MTFEHISEPLSRAIEKIADQYGKGNYMAFDKNQLPDLKDREKAAHLLNEWNKATSIVDAADEDKSIDDDEYRKLDDAADAARQAYRDLDVELITDENNQPVCCEMSGVFLVEGDDLLERAKDRSRYLAAAFDLPPPSEPEGQALPEMEDVA